MGNCQAVDAAALVIQHPSGKIERFYWPMTANEEQKAVLFTRVKLLRPDETLTLGHAYRLITTQEVMKVLKAKKRKPQGKTVEAVQQMVHLENGSSACETSGMLDTGKVYKAMRADRQRLKAASGNPVAARPKSWRPSLHSISESAS